MAKAKTNYTCSECGGTSSKWSGQCPACGQWNTMVETIVEGRAVQHQLTIPEGLTSEQIVARLLDNDILAGNIKDVPREGSLLPDGYHFHRGFTREQMIQRMRQAQERLVRDVWERRNPDLPLKSPEQLVILASIIEKETGKPEERTRIAAVLTNRLKQKMKLQSLLVTRGRDGMVIFSRGQKPVIIPIHGSDEVADVTGAGDTVIATYTAALAAGADAESAARLANYAGGIVVMKRGTATVTRSELLRAVMEA